MSTASETRLLALPDDKVLIVRLGRDSAVSDNYDLYHRHLEAHPEQVDFHLLVDWRGWAGILADDAIRDNMAWLEDFRDSHGLPPRTGTRAIFLVTRRSGLIDHVEHFQRLRGIGTAVVHSIEEAWSHVVPGAAPPEAARRFLARRFFPWADAGFI